MVDYPIKSSYTAEDLIAITAILRDPAEGCPWDKVQTHQSIRKNFLEETYEALEAIDAQDSHLLCEELGDVLMQVVLHAQMEAEQGHFTFSNVCTSVCEKLISRHPHIFLNVSGVKTENDGLNTWEMLKNKEKGRKTLADELTSVPKPLPALMKTQKTQKRAAPYGKVPANTADAALARSDAHAAWQAAKPQDGKAKTQSEAAAAQGAAGALLFSLVNEMRLAGVDAEEALELANAQFVAAALEESQFSDAK